MNPAGGRPPGDAAPNNVRDSERVPGWLILLVVLILVGVGAGALAAVGIWT